MDAHTPLVLAARTRAAGRPRPEPAAQNQRTHGPLPRVRGAAAGQGLLYPGRLQHQRSVVQGLDVSSFCPPFQGSYGLPGKFLLRGPHLPAAWCPPGYMGVPMKIAVRLFSCGGVKATPSWPILSQFGFFECLGVCHSLNF